MPPSELGCCGHRNSTSGSAIWGKTVPERISKLVLRGQRHPCPHPCRRRSPAQTCLSQSPSLPGLLICQGSSLRCRMRTVEPSSTGCHGDVKHCHLPIPLPAAGQHGLGQVWGLTCLPSHSSGAHPTSSIPPVQAKARAQRWLASLPVQGATGTGEVGEGDARVSQVVSLHFPSFPFHAFLFPFLALPSSVAGPSLLPSDVHQCRQEESGLCRAMDGAQEDKMLSCTRKQFLFELRWEEARGKPSAGRESNWAAAHATHAFSLQLVNKEGFLQESPLLVCPKMQTRPGQMRSEEWIPSSVFHGWFRGHLTCGAACSCLRRGGRMPQGWTCPGEAGSADPPSSPNQRQGQHAARGDIPLLGPGL